ncbi:glycosyltransferase [Adhaeribacter sp. BT258]|uniref:Glycosyltransferase n=1 Tax=Adhaeribacter terrigena TaxID=2793070 RepID=A0ABS1C3I1_9BACT|nr:glycosyltransferase [Adhaeribacter terrigena]MBK0403939.1 glycosyltransferase [Adhaeribacter terrigena]
MKKIVFAVTTDLNYDQRMQRICKSLAGNGYEILLVGRRWPVSKPLQPQPYAQHRLQCFFSKGKFFYLEYNLRLFFFLLFKNADAFGAADLDAALPVCFKARMSGKPFIFDAHEYFPEVPEVISRPAIQKMWRAVEKFIVPRSALRYTVTSSLAGIFTRNYRVPFSVIRNISVLKPFVKTEKEQRYILYQGAVNEGRGLEMLLEVMPEINADLWICGKGEMLETLQRRARELKLENKVKFLGYVLPADLEKITRRAYLGFNLLENLGLSYYYSLSNKFFDYLHAGIPQVVIDFPEYETLLQEFEVGVAIPLEKAALKTALQELLTDEKRYDFLVKNCLLARETWNWQQEEKKLLALYETLWQTQQKLNS